jgi:hypothetical protein
MHRYCGVRLGFRMRRADSGRSQRLYFDGACFTPADRQATPSDSDLEGITKRSDADDLYDGAGQHAELHDAPTEPSVASDSLHSYWRCHADIVQSHKIKGNLIENGFQIQLPLGPSAFLPCNERNLLKGLQSL